MSNYNLMDYSLLFVVQFNEKYVEKNEHEFVHDESGNLVRPLKEIEKEVLQSNKVASEEITNESIK